MSLYPNGCTRCGSYAYNSSLHGRDDTDHDLCDVCYWRKRAEQGDDTSIRADLRRTAAKQGPWAHLSSTSWTVANAFTTLREPDVAALPYDAQSWFLLFVAEAL